MARDRICVIGSEEMVLGFRLLGIPGDIPAGPEEVRRILRERFAEPGMALILIEDRVAAQAPDLLAELQGAKEFPLVVKIPGPGGPLGEESIRDFIVGAIGVRL
ncbi:V-type ATP synthase subunit F [Candidatus Bipolaricaulota sp. J31]